MAFSPEWPNGGLPKSWARQAALTMVPISSKRVSFNSGRFSSLEVAGNIVAKRHSYTRHFQTMGEAVMHEDATWQREYLGLVLQATES